MPAAGFSISPPPPSGVEFEAKITTPVVMSSVMVAIGGLMFGYDIGVSGGVTSMLTFQREFFPSVLTYYRRKESNYCKYDNQGLHLFTSSLYLAGLPATLLATYTTRRLGRRPTMLMAGALFIVGVIFSGAAQNLAMLIVGRMLLGCGVGFVNHAVPLFLTEIAPTRIRGGLSVLFQLNISIGILFANLVNYGTDRIRPWGWRLSLSLAAIPGALLTLSALLVVDTPHSLIERGRLEEGKAALKKIRGTDDVEPEFHAIVEASRIAREVKHPFRNLLRHRNRPQLAVAVLLQIFQQLAGMNAIMFYAPLLFITLGFKTDAALYYAVIIGAVIALSTLVSVYVVDRAGRRMLLLEAGVYMFLSQAAFAVVLRIKVTDHTDDIDHAWGVNASWPSPWSAPSSPPLAGPGVPSPGSCPARCSHLRRALRGRASPSLPTSSSFSSQRRRSSPCSAASSTLSSSSSLSGTSSCRYSSYSSSRRPRRYPSRR
ncbi:unnamed protein product [Urochloa humidicola]